MKRLRGVITLLLVSFAGAQSNIASPPQTQQTRETRFEVITPPTTDTVSLAISPNGDKIAFIAAAEGNYRLWVHSLASGTARSLPGTEDASLPLPCWSPDNNSLAYFGDNKLKRVDIDTGTVQTLATNGRNGRGCSWNRDGTILYAGGAARVIFRISEQGGPSLPATMPDEFTPQLPHFLPDGRHFLYYGVGGGVFVAEIAGSPPIKLVDADSAAVYSGSGHLLFVRKDNLYGQKFDPVTLKVTGDPFLVAEQVPVTAYMPAVSTSLAGPVVYRTGLVGTARQFKWLDRAGKEIANVGEPMMIGSSALALSPNGRFVAMNSTPNGNSDIYLLEVANGKLLRLTEDPALDVFPVWSADSATVYFGSNRLGPFELYEKPITGNVPEKLVMQTRATRPLRDASRDGRFLLYKTSADIAAVQLDGNPRGEFPVIQTPGIEDWPQFSPDTKWVAFQSDESGRVEIYIQQFPAGRRWQISKGGGAHARWHPGGKELVYIASDGQLLALPFEVAANGQEIKMGDAKALFKPPIVRNVADGAWGQQYMFSNDGERFLIATVEEVRSPIKVIRNWKP